MTISVVLCTHNGARFIEEQLSSILAQERLPSEIVISDDASSDGTLDVVETFLAGARVAHPEIRFHVVKNLAPLGVVRNFEAALRLATGSFIALCDQDDVWLPSKLRVLAARLENDPSLALLHSDARLVGEHGDPLGLSLFDALRISRSILRQERKSGGFPQLMKRNIVTGATVLFRRSLLDVAGDFPRSWVHDEWLAAVGAATTAIDYEAAELIDYRQHSQNQIGAQQLNFSARFERLRAGRTVRNERLLSRAAALVAHLDVIRDRVHPSALILAGDKLSHEQVRSSLPVNRFLRTGPVVRELLSGRYFSCGLGLQDVIRDVLQPGEAST